MTANRGSGRPTGPPELLRSESVRVMVRPGEKADLDSVADPHTGVVPLANEWYRFSVEATFTGTETLLRAKVWNEVEAEPQGWQQECTDSGPAPLAMGTIGVWSMGPGAKYWDDFSVQNPDAPRLECDANSSSPSAWSGPRASWQAAAKRVAASDSIDDQEERCD